MIIIKIYWWLLKLKTSRSIFSFRLQMPLSACSYVKAFEVLLSACHVAACVASHCGIQKETCISQISQKESAILAPGSKTYCISTHIYASELSPFILKDHFRLMQHFRQMQDYSCFVRPKYLQSQLQHLNTKTVCFGSEQLYSTGGGVRAGLWHEVKDLKNTLLFSKCCWPSSCENPCSGFTAFCFSNIFFLYISAELFQPSNNIYTLHLYTRKVGEKKNTVTCICSHQMKWNQIKSNQCKGNQTLFIKLFLQQQL